MVGGLCIRVDGDLKEFTCMLVSGKSTLGVEVNTLRERLLVNFDLKINRFIYYSIK